MAFRTPTRWYGKLFNERVARRLRTDPQHRLNNTHLLITMVRRKSGTQLTLPVNYRQLPDGNLVIGTEASWWLNLKNGADVEVEVAGEKHRGIAAPVLDDAEKRQRLGRVISGITWPLFNKSLVVIEIRLKR